MPKVRARAPHEVRVVFDGQSLNNWPAMVPYPRQLMSGTGVPYATVALDGISWTQLATTAPARLFRQAVAAISILVLCGGTSDLFFEADAAAKVYADMRDYAVRARAAGFTTIIATTITPSSWFDAFPVMHTRRAAANVLILADADNAFDAVADLAAGAGLANNQSAAYVDGTHWSYAGAAEAASIVRPVLAPFLEAA